MLQDSQKAMSMSLNGYNIEDAKILHLGGKPLNAAEGKYICHHMVDDTNPRFLNLFWCHLKYSVFFFF